MMRKLLAVFIFTILCPLFANDCCVGNNSGCLDRCWTFFQPCDPKCYVGFGPFLGNRFSAQQTSLETAERSGAGSSISSTTKQKNPGVGFWGLLGYQMNKMLSYEFEYRQYAWQYSVNTTKAFSRDPLMSLIVLMQRLHT